MPASDKNQILLQWQAPEYNQVERHPDWEWIAGLLAFFVILVSIFFKNFLFALIVLIGTYSLIHYERRDPSWRKVEISTNGIRIANDFYSFKTVRSFWVEDNKDIDVLIIHSGRLIFPNVHIYFDSIDPAEVRQNLARFLPEIKPTETIIDKIGEYFGF